jgi:hypothetical protein
MAKQNVLPIGGAQDQRLFALASVLLGRAELAARMGKSYGTDRDIYTALGYTKNPVYNDYLVRYERQDIAKRIVEAPVDATWRGRPQVVEIGDHDEETEFEAAWVELVRALDAYHYIARADKISGIGEYGVMLLGFDDRADLDKPVDRAQNLLYLHPYSQQNANIDSWVKDTRDKRYGQPETYKIDFSSADKTGTMSARVHWSRIIHLAEGLFENNVYGTPRLRPVLNRLQDLDLISGGSAEMFWRGGFPGYGFKNDPDATVDAQAMADLQDEIEEYVHGLKRYLRLQNMSVEALEVQIADPTSHFDLIVSLISAATGVPKRILTGSERGELASTQDRENWADRVQERRDNYAGPRILRETIDRLVGVGALPEPGKEGYEIQWPEAHVLSEEDKAKVAEVKAKALAQYVNAVGADMVVPPDVFLKRFLGFEQQEVDEINEQIKKMKKEEEAEVGGTTPPAATPPGQAPGQADGEQAPTDEDEI